jgi:hypothetical protein
MPLSYWRGRAAKFPIIPTRFGNNVLTKINEIFSTATSGACLHHFQGKIFGPLVIGFPTIWYTSH